MVSTIFRLKNIFYLYRVNTSFCTESKCLVIDRGLCLMTWAYNLFPNTVRIESHQVRIPSLCSDVLSIIFKFRKLPACSVGWIMIQRFHSHSETCFSFNFFMQPLYLSFTNPEVFRYVLWESRTNCRYIELVTSVFPNRFPSKRCLCFWWSLSYCRVLESSPVIEAIIWHSMSRLDHPAQFEEVPASRSSKK